MPSNLESKDSSNVGWARYDAATRTLEIDFKDAKGHEASTYAYDDFPPGEWDAFCAAESKGRWFAYNIRFRKPPYVYRKLTPPSPAPPQPPR